MKKLPKLYKNYNTSNNNKNYCYLKNIEDNNTTTDELNKILNISKHIYDIKYEINTKDKKYITYIISKTKDAIYTLEDEKILINDIISIKKIA